MSAELLTEIAEFLRDVANSDNDRVELQLEHALDLLERILVFEGGPILP